LTSANQQVVVIGAGIVGNSVAYHLTQLGVTDVTLIDKGALPTPGGSTGHASNFIFPVDHSSEVTSLILESMRQYDDLGLLHECGGIEAARTPERMQELERRISSAISWGVEGVRIVTPAEIRELIPYVDVSQFLGGAYTPVAAVVESVPAANVMRDRAVAAGVSVRDQTEVTGFRVEGGRVRAVQTSSGELRAQAVVIACGAWSPRVARMAGASIPLTPMIHQKVKLGPIRPYVQSGKLIGYPIMRDMDQSMYEHQKWGDMEVGSYAHRPIALDPDEIPSIAEAELSPTEMPLTQDDFDPQWKIARELIPELLNDPAVTVQHAINGVLSVTFDGSPLLGETEVRGLWSAAAVWVREGPATGKTIAELIVHGYSEVDVHSCDVARAYPHERSREHIVQRASESFRKMYGIVHPAEQWSSQRGLRLSPFHERERALGASFIETAGWERPNWYECNALLLEEYGERIPRREAEWESRWWSPIINAEHLAMRDRAGLFDLTAFCIFDVSGPGSLQALQRIAVRQMDVPVGRVVYTPVLAPNGGFRADLTIMRLGQELFRVVTGGAHGMADMKCFRDQLPSDGSVQIHDQTDALTTLGLWGPRARDILSELMRADISNEGLPFGHCATIEVGSLPVIASRISYVGDLGWELYAPIAEGAKLWDLLFEAGSPHGLIPAGNGVYAGTGRLEKCYRAYGAELDTGFTAAEAGMAVGKVKDADFTGKEAYVAQRESEPAALLCALTVDDHTSATGAKRYMLGGEPVLTRAGDPLTDSRGRRSFVTSAGSGPSLGQFILMSYLPPEQAVSGTQLAVRYMGELYPVTVRSTDSTPLFDPTNARVRG
jgi:glycine cleavage system aminomethyltransferase T/glycine/D-amino acid oxidase-like deaminating enzyme